MRNIRKFSDFWSTGTSVRTFSTMLALAMFIGFGVSMVKAQAITEGFDVITTLPAAGWATQNNSVPVGTTGWFQGSATLTSQSGPPTAYIGANFNNTTGTNTISNWLMAPNRTMNNGDVYKFWTRTTTANPFPDRLQVRLSTAGASTNVGTGPTGIGDFTTLLLDINPFYDTGGVYPEVWTEYTITISGLSGPTSGRLAFRYFVEGGGPTGDNSNFIGIDTFSYTPGTPAAPGDAPVDFNGDGRTDYAVVRNTGGGPGGQVTWFYNLNNSANPTAAFAWGLETDFFITEDFDNDNKDDIAVWRPGAPTVASFYIFNSATSTVRVEAFGQTGDDPSVVDDYNGDGSADLAVYRAGAASGDPSFWYYRTVANGPVTYMPWGQNGDFPAPGDYDGNGSADFAIQRSIGGGQAAFWTKLSTGATSFTVFGTPTDVVVPGDYDGDGKTDIATVRGSGGVVVWYWRPSGGGADQQVSFGASASDSPIQGDYDGDGKTDVAVWRAGVFWVRSTASGAVSNFTLGSTGDFPVANYNSH
ncbi:MAG: VCBS repeat-containing protein [Pyrinomonadaceae bacterium]|nr:VCBS repeat-containing protein [Pyrinomonadaceae bacterium]